jgi:hypothetical protein
MTVEQTSLLRLQRLGKSYWGGWLNWVVPRLWMGTSSLVNLMQEAAMAGVVRARLIWPSRRTWRWQEVGDVSKILIMAVVIGAGHGFARHK